MISTESSFERTIIIISTKHGKNTVWHPASPPFTHFQHMFNSFLFLAHMLNLEERERGRAGARLEGRWVWAEYPPFLAHITFLSLPCALFLGRRTDGRRTMSPILVAAESLLRCEIAKAERNQHSFQFQSGFLLPIPGSRPPVKAG